MTEHDDYGQLQQADGRCQLTFRRTLAHPPTKVWRALTQPDHLAVWFPTAIEGDRVEGAALRFVFRNAEGPELDGEMITFDPPQTLEMRWGDERLRFHLEPDGSSTVLTFSHTFDELGKAARDAAGWHVCLDQLGGLLDGVEPADPEVDAWKEVHRTYVQRLGPDASTIGPPDSRVEYQ